jgi:LPS-assembly lipoprotein
MTRFPVAELQHAAQRRFDEGGVSGSRRARPRVAARYGALARAAIVLLVASASGCGFHLQGAGSLPPALAKTYLHSVAPHSDFMSSLTETLRLRGSQVVPSEASAEAVLDIVADDTGQRVLSVTARNIPREYEVYYTVTFSLQVGEQTLIDKESLVVTRSYTYDETQVLAKASEEEILRTALAEDLARRVVRRIEGLGATAAAVPPAPTSPPTQQN